MKKRKIQLTISLLVSNHIDTIRSCMESIQPLLENVASELIVVDTVGEENSDGSLEVARGYAHKVVPFQWCNDFSAARNAGLKHANGEWFLFLDDDEWFEDVSEIIAFFKSGEYKNYGIAAYVQRNYLDLQGTAYNDASVVRMVRLYRNTQFVRAVHEKFNHIYGDIKYLDSFAHHYGYCFANEEDKKAHELRNITLLENEIEKHPNSLENIMYLVNEYVGTEDFAKGEELCYSAIYETFQSPNEHELNLNWIRLHYIKMLFFQKKYEETVAKGKKLLESFAFNDVAAGTIYMILSEACEALGEWDKAFEYSCYYIAKYDILNGTEGHYRSQEHMNMTKSDMQMFVDSVIRRGIYSGLKCNKGEEVGKLIQWLWLGGFDRNVAISYIEKFKKEDKTYSEILTKGLSQIYDEHTYILLNKLLSFMAEGEGSEAAQRAFDRFVEKKEYDVAYMGDIMKVVIKHGLHIGELASRINDGIWGVWVNNAYPQLGRVEREALHTVLENSLLPECRIKHMIFSHVINKYILLYKVINKEGLTWADMHSYCNESLAGYHCIYKEELFLEQNRDNLPEEAQFILYVEKVLECKDNGHWAEGMGLLKMALAIYPSMKVVVEQLLEMVDKAAEESRVAEFNNLKNKLIQTALDFVNAGNRGAANMILKNLKKLQQEDEEILLLEQRIDNMY